jgi:hypothetical protein
VPEAFAAHFAHHEVLYQSKYDKAAVSRVFEATDKTGGIEI